MAKDKLGLHWKDPDDELYTAMIWALSIGIVIVIVTLFLTRPGPESFSELYFNDHTNLPEYINLNTEYNYSFSIHNLENKNITYNYTITTQYYDLDYTCEKPEIYLELINSTRITETNDPALYIKEYVYTVRFNYELKYGNNISFKLIDINNNPRYSININNDKLYYTANNYTQQFNLNKSNNNIHRFSMRVTPLLTLITLDSQTFNLTNNISYSNGFIQLETIDTYAEFSNFQITRGTINEPVTIRFSDAKYTKYKLAKDNNSYVSNDSINLTNYTIKTVFIAYSTLDLYLKNDMIISYDKNSSILSVNNSNSISNYSINTTKSNNIITTNIANNTLELYYNDEYITTINTTTNNILPKIEYTNLTISDLYIKSNDAPITISYDIEPIIPTQKSILTVNSLLSFKENISEVETIPTVNNITAGLTTTEKDTFMEYYNQEKINYTNYRTTIAYTDKSRKNVFNIALSDLNGTIYSLTLDNTNRTATLIYTSNNTTIIVESPIVSSVTNRIILNINNNNLNITHNSRQIFNIKADKLSDGIILFDYRNIVLSLAQIQDLLTSKVITLRKQANVACDPILTNEYVYTNTLDLLDTQIATIKEKTFFNQTFDIAKVQVNINDDQEIHYWVKLI
ncbi:MAG: hypothetical protein ACP5N1_02935 [Candidatus Woesearchaeota archaeon]